MAKHYEVTNEILATQGQRFTNFLIDYIARILLLVIFVVFVLMSGKIAGDFDTFLFKIESMDKITEMTIEYSFLVLYYAIFEIATGRTLGKYITQTVVVDEYGDKPLFSVLIKRSFCRIIPFNAFSFLIKNGRGWHDTISDTYVVQKELLDKNKELFYSFNQIGKSPNEN